MLLPEDDVTEGRKLQTSIFNSSIDSKNVFGFCLDFQQMFKPGTGFQVFKGKKRYFSRFLPSGRARKKEKLKNQAQQ